MGKFIVTESVSYEVCAPDASAAHGLAMKNLVVDLNRIADGEMTATEVFDSKVTGIIL